MTILLTITIVAVTYAYYWYKKNMYIDALRKKKKPSVNKLRITKQTEKNQSFKCVMIHTDDTACQSAKALANNPILVEDAGPLPLNTCDASACHCGYLRYADRRMNARRRDISGAEYFTSYSKNRRDQHDRRKLNLVQN